jgi:phage-related protein
VVETLTTTILQNLPMLIEMGIQMFVSLIQGISDMLPTLIPLAIDTVILLVETLLDNIDLIIDAGIELIMNLGMGLIDALPRLVEKIPVIIDKLLSAIFNNFPLILDAGIELVLALADGLIKAIPQLLQSLPVIIGKLINGLIGAIPQLITAGGQLLAGLFKGLLNPTAIWNAVKSLFNGIVGGIKELFGIHSPSTVMADVVGKNLALGLGEGFDETMGDVSKEMANAIPTEFDTEIGTNINVASGQSQMSTYDTMVKAFKQALTEVKVVMNDREMGGFVTKTVERVVFG